MKYFLDRLAERSTWIGLTTIASALGIALTPDQAAAIAAAGAGVAGAIIAFTKG